MSFLLDSLNQNPDEAHTLWFVDMPHISLIIFSLPLSLKNPGTVESCSIWILLIVFSRYKHLPLSSRFSIKYAFNLDQTPV